MEHDRAQASVAHDLGTQVRRRGSLVLVVALVGVSAAALLAAVGRHQDVPLADLSRDPAAVAHLPVYVGGLAYLAFIGWATGVGAAVTGALVASRLALRPRQWSLLVAAMLSLWLLLDDMFEFHESVLPRLGIPERLTYGIYVLALAAWLWFSRRSIRDSDWLVLVVALGFFGLSAALDEIFHGSNTYAYVEDVFKLLGTWLWSAYLVLTAARDVPAVGARAPVDTLPIEEVDAPGS